jgi:hypothetical protein
MFCGFNIVIGRLDPIYDSALGSRHFGKAPPSFPDLLRPLLYFRRYNRFHSSLCDPYFSDRLRRYFDLCSRSRIMSQAFFPFGGTRIRIPFRELTYNLLWASRRLIPFLPTDLPFSRAAPRPCKKFLFWPLDYACCSLLSFCVSIYCFACNLKFLGTAQCFDPHTPCVSQCPAQSIPYLSRP